MALPRSGWSRQQRYAGIAVSRATRWSRLREIGARRDDPSPRASCTAATASTVANFGQYSAGCKVRWAVPGICQPALGAIGDPEPRKARVASQQHDRREPRAAGRVRRHTWPAEVCATATECTAARRARRHRCRAGQRGGKGSPIARAGRWRCSSSPIPKLARRAARLPTMAPLDVAAPAHRLRLKLCVALQRAFPARLALQNSAFAHARYVLSRRLRRLHRVLLFRPEVIALASPASQRGRGFLKADRRGLRSP